MTRTPMADSFKLTPTEVPEKKTVYGDVIEEFLASEVESVLVEGDVAEKVRPSTLVTSLTTAARGKGVTIRRVDDKVYLKRKPVKPK